MKKSSSEHVQSHALRGWLFLFIVVVLIVGGVMFWREQVGAPRDGDTDVRTGVPESVVVEEGDKEKVVIDRKRKYQLEVPKEWKITGIDDTLILDGLIDSTVGSSGVSGAGCKVVVKPTDIKDLDEHFSNFCSSNDECDNYEIQSVRNKIKSVSVTGSFMGSGDVEYYLDAGDNSGFDRLTFVCSSKEEEDVYRDQILNSFVRTN